jgi:predicted ATP-grasp superfamily ATP-dependent carboligase
VKKERLLILGASVRAAALSAAAAGYEVIAADQFADRDLREICPNARPVKYPEGLLEFAMTVEPCAWMYTGALENYPEIVGKISERHELLGNGAEVLRRVRGRKNLEWFAQVWLHEFPDSTVGNPIQSKKWLIKREASGGGLGIRVWDGTEQLRPGEYFQEWIEGRCGSAGFIADSQRVQFMFATEELSNAAFLAAPRFLYQGSWFFSSMSPEWMTSDDIIRLGVESVAHFELQGLFGIDFVIRNNEICFLEINPRYTASMELFEKWNDRSLIEAHARSWEAARNSLHTLTLSPAFTGVRGHPKAALAKGVLYSREHFHITDRMSDRLWAMRGELDLADLPVGGSAIGKGHPVLTIFAEGDSREETMRSLEAKANQLRALGVP